MHRVSVWSKPINTPRLSEDGLRAYNVPAMMIHLSLRRQGKQPRGLQWISDAIDSRIQDIMTYIMPRERVRQRHLIFASAFLYC